ncbi:hypothetical protein A2774_01040 [Candidatus Roizmanbacteria bacterium RIFCSPHIGHO2_01_FULL_39_12c]|uniref:5'-deoxynucleotidase n=1 Tax=Candidatus Roizmanbacteria bacterium RIFCSPHIGHO2_01_FULL_39_12c TaxID=1802031 RepID=A0A1F7G8B0_9BACT|nr:MAG: hypothetical protein A2774_01040 [Candidatus Roizmanbacteria bacterium RIFCSPHIGHO2_01_FULL_39_12c]OGK46417.1 MAG: hypothetical protein A2963_01450 [Candidatus Roizmanbacteria bacterium RIFCSPLOWO2_01_FULL_40_13]
MKIKNRNPALLLKGMKVDPIIEFYFELNHLKQLFRQGWLLRGIPENKCESVADHLFGSAILALIIANSYYESLDLNKMLKMVLIHELGEIYLGDVTPRDRINKNLKHEWEYKAVVEIFSKIPKGNQYISLWKEYEEGASPEAKFIKQVDRLEAAFQAVVYKLQYNNKQVEDFYPWTKKRLSDKKLIKLLNDLQAIHNETSRK